MDGNIAVWLDERSRSSGDIYGYDFETGIEFPICTRGDLHDPAISGDIVVWTDRRSGTGDIYGYDLTSQSEFPICTEISEQRGACIDGNWVAWLDYRDMSWSIYGYDLSTHQEFLITANSAGSEGPVISGDTVVWRTLDSSGYDIYGYTFSTQTIFPICTDANKQDEPTIDGNYVAWYDYRAGNDYPDLYCYDLSKHQELLISTGCDPDPTSIRISGSYIVWSQERNNEWGIYGYNLDNNQEISICTGWQKYFHIDNNIVAWVDNRNGNYNIYGYDLITRQEFPIDIDPYYQEYPRVCGNYICWQDEYVGIEATSLLANDDTIFSTEVLLGQVVSGSTVGATGADMTTLGYNDFKDNWHYFVPDSNDKYTISVCGSDFDTTLAVFDEVLVEVEFNDNFCGDQSKLVLRGKAGKKYYVRIAGYDGESGNYTLSIIKDSPEPLRSDVNFDGKVDMGDFAVMAFEWLSDNQN